MDAKKRPTRVTVIAWIIIVTSSLGLVSTPFTATMPQVKRMLEATGTSVPIALLLAFVAGGIGLVSGVAMLRGINWGRLLYLGFTPFSFALSWVLYGFRPLYILSVLFYLVVLVLLTRPAASVFFSSKASAVSKPEG